MSRWASSRAAVLIVPSPPPATSRSGPRSMAAARRARARRAGRRGTWPSRVKPAAASRDRAPLVEPAAPAGVGVDDERRAPLPPDGLAQFLLRPHRPRPYRRMPGRDLARPRRAPHGHTSPRTRSELGAGGCRGPGSHPTRMWATHRATAMVCGMHDRRTPRRVGERMPLPTMLVLAVFVLVLTATRSIGLCIVFRSTRRAIPGCVPAWSADRAPPCHAPSPDPLASARAGPRPEASCPFRARRPAATDPLSNSPLRIWSRHECRTDPAARCRGAPHVHHR